MLLVFLLSGIFEGTLCFTDGVTFSYLSISHNETLSTGKKTFSRSVDHYGLILQKQSW